MNDSFWDIASRLADLAVRDGGWTFYTYSGVVPTTGYSVGGDPDLPERVIPNYRAMHGPALLMAIGQYLFEMEMAGKTVSGGWVRDDGALVLDCPRIVPERTTAVLLGRARGEDAIYSLTDGETITL